MSACVSRHGEFSEHTLDDSYICTLCGVLDEEALRAELAQARSAIHIADATTGRRTAQRDQARAELRDAHNDLLDVRGILSPNGYEPVTPLPLVPTVAPAVQWLVDQLAAVEQDRDRLRGQLAQLKPVLDAVKAWRELLRYPPSGKRPLAPILRAGAAVIDAIDAAEPSGTEAGRACRADCDEIPGYCTSGSGCLGSAPEAVRLPHAPCRETGEHQPHPWGDPAHWCDGSGEAGA